MCRSIGELRHRTGMSTVPRGCIISLTTLFRAVMGGGVTQGEMEVIEEKGTKLCKQNHTARRVSINHSHHHASWLFKMTSATRNKAVPVGLTELILSLAHLRAKYENLLHPQQYNWQLHHTPSLPLARCRCHHHRPFTSPNCISSHYRNLQLPIYRRISSPNPPPKSTKPPHHIPSLKKVINKKNQSFRL